jgi:hypothetical protein
MEYICHATATACASAPRITITRASWYRLKSREAKASTPRQTGRDGDECMLNVKVKLQGRLV